MIHDLMQQRASVRMFSPQKISIENINSILDSARLSPSGGNEQQFIFGIIDEHEIIKKISEKSYGQKWICNAPLLIALCTKIKPDNDGGREIQKQRFPQFINEIDQMSKELYTCINLEEHQTKIPGTIIMLHALELGICSTWISRFDVCEVKKLLNFPENIYPSEILALGYPNGEIKHLKKKELNEIVFTNRF